jgi:26S proteasome regulatory subunit N9
MKAMSLELIKGTIDEVDEVVHVDWILPRYLNMGHIRIIVDKLGDWENKLEEVIKLTESNSQELLSH